MNSEARILAEHFQLRSSGQTQTETQGFAAGMSVAEAEKALIFETLKHTENNRTRAAELLGISIRTLRNKLNEYEGSMST